MAESPRQISSRTFHSPWSGHFASGESLPAGIRHSSSVTPRTSTGTRLPTLQALERAARDRLTQLDWSQLPEVRRPLLDALGAVLHGADAARQLTVLLRAHPGWDAVHRAVASEGLFGVALWRRRLVHHAGILALKGDSSCLKHRDLARPAPPTECRAPLRLA